MDTRTRIQEVALELFTEQGYEKTALREIAERLGVTKAALYYHFKSKEEIVQSFVDDRIQLMDNLIEWAETQPPTVETKRAALRRYADELFAHRGGAVMRFFEQNQTALKNLPAGIRMRERMMTFAGILAGPDPTPHAQVRAALSVFAVHTSLVGLPTTLDRDERIEVGLSVAYELLDRNEIGAATAVAASDWLARGLSEIEAQGEQVDAVDR
jgi:AcrR family transcriptional regulator